MTRQPPAFCFSISDAVGDDRISGCPSAARFSVGAGASLSRDGIAVRDAVDSGDHKRCASSEESSDGCVPCVSASIGNFEADGRGCRLLPSPSENSSMSLKLVLRSKWRQHAFVRMSSRRMGALGTVGVLLAIESRSYLADVGRSIVAPGGNDLII